GACSDEKRAGCGGVTRGSQGEWLGSFAKKVGDCDAFTAEFWGVLEGLCMESKLDFSNMWNGRVQGLSNYSSVRKIHNMLNMEWIVEFMHEYRKANKCADVLARIGCSLEYNVIFYGACTEEIREFMLADELGFVTH
ncbi:ribonuclease H protein, partial [Trifolium medium]|nr:ribonuclease H protein [Trifolium medium]